MTPCLKSDSGQREQRERGEEAAAGWCHGLPPIKRSLGNLQRTGPEAPSPRPAHSLRDTRSELVHVKKPSNSRAALDWLSGGCGWDGCQQMFPAALCVVPLVRSSRPGIDRAPLHEYKCKPVKSRDRVPVNGFMLGL
ncbi:unnamed protein product [Pleuronectes platessa]|uniref:Uncharacterized protein n=1 Tax=Pleuronectes platessa TaxID=8262 RepID=A0A9N7YWT2_PLEPL|nr:unnamed protein product [Pleuronectes platessa]